MRPMRPMHPARPMRPMRPMPMPVRLLLAAVAIATAACSGPILANEPAERPAPAVTPAPSARPVDPQPVTLPADDAPHHRLTEWWYYTGHLRTADGQRLGFEQVVFRAERGGFPVSWASHLAITDETGNAFHYAQRAEIGPQVDQGSASGAADGFNLVVSGFDIANPTQALGTPWVMTGADGTDTLAAQASGAEVGGDPITTFGLALQLRAVKPAALHDRDGYIDFGAAGGSYYYSRTTMDARGTVTLGNRTLDVEGDAWFDHQWGDFISVGGGGWDWFAVNLDDGTDLTLSLVRAADGSYPLVYGTLVDAQGATTHLGPGDFTVTVTGHWTSPRTGAVYPAGWTLALPGQGLEVQLTPAVAQQELDTRATTGVVYWEGSQRVTATRAGATLGGQAYVELTGYATAP